MSLQSDYELSADAKFRGKVLAALSRVALEVLQESEDEKEQAFCKRTLNNIHYVAEQLYPSVAAVESVDTSADDRIIVDAVKRVFKRLF